MYASKQSRVRKFDWSKKSWGAYLSQLDLDAKPVVMLKNVLLVGHSSSHVFDIVELEPLLSPSQCQGRSVDIAMSDRKLLVRRFDGFPISDGHDGGASFVSITDRQHKALVGNFWISGLSPTFDPCQGA